MQREEITAVTSEEEVPQDDPKEDAAPAETFPEEAPEETVAEAETPETVTEETDTEEAPEETITEETDTEEDTPEETVTEETDTEEDTIQETEEYPSIPDLEYDVFEQILAEQQAANTLLVRITNQNDLFLGIGVALIICCICYSVLERFTRF